MPDCADCEAGSYYVKGIDVNAALGTAEGMCTFEGIKLGIQRLWDGLAGSALEGDGLGGDGLGDDGLGGGGL